MTSSEHREGNPAILNVVYCFDEVYALYSAVSIFSLLLSTAEPVQIYCVCNSVSSGSLRTIERVCSRFAAKLSIVDVPDSPFEKWKPVAHVPPSSYLRVLIPTLIEQDVALYLDGDTLVLDDILKLRSVHIPTEKHLAGVPDLGGERSTRIPRIAGDRYLNSGVLLMNLASMRRDDFLHRCMRSYATYEREIVWSDQCVINKAAEGRKVVLESRWNTQIFSQHTTEAQWHPLVNGGASIAHFVGPMKPWHEWCNPVISAVWWTFARMSGVAGLSPVPASTVDQVRLYASVLDRLGRHQEASAAKERVIEALVDALSLRR